MVVSLPSGQCDLDLKVRLSFLEILQMQEFENKVM